MRKSNKIVSVILTIVTLILLMIFNENKEYEIIKKIETENDVTIITNVKGPENYYISRKKKCDLNEPHDNNIFSDIVVKQLKENSDDNSVYKIYFYYESESDEDYEEDGLPTFLTYYKVFS